MKKSFFKYLPRIIAAFILLQTLYFKFGLGGPEALAESQRLFSTLTQEALGNPELESTARIGTGIMELIASILILVPSTALYGAVLGAMTMVGAIASHFLFIGIVVDDDGGQLLTMAFIVLISCLKVVVDEKEKLKSLLGKA